MSWPLPQQVSTLHILLASGLSVHNSTGDSASLQNVMRPVGCVKSAGKSCANWVKQEDGLWIISRYSCPAAACSFDDHVASCLLSSISWSSLHVSAMISTILDAQTCCERLIWWELAYNASFDNFSKAYNAFRDRCGVNACQQGSMRHAPNSM